MIAVMCGWAGLRGVLPAAAVCGIAFAGTQFFVSNFIGPELTDVLASMAAMGALFVLIKVWKPRDKFDFGHLPPGKVSHSGRADPDREASRGLGRSRLLRREAAGQPEVRKWEAGQGYSCIDSLRFHYRPSPFAGQLLFQFENAFNQAFWPGRATGDIHVNGKKFVDAFDHRVLAGENTVKFDWTTHASLYGIV